MDKMVSCKDFGVECNFTACAETEVELFEKVLEHSRNVHQMKDFSPEFYNRVRTFTQEGYCGLEEEDLYEYGECCC